MGEEYAVRGLMRALADERRAAEQVLRYERARLTHAPAYQAALAMLEACGADVGRAYAALREYRIPAARAALREANP